MNVPFRHLGWLAAGGGILPVALLFCGLSLAAGHGRPPGADLPAAVTVPTAHLRLWKTDLPGMASLRLTRQPVPSRDGGKKTAAVEITTAGPGYQFGDYLDIPAGRCVLQTTVGGNGRTFSSTPADLRAGSYITLLVNAAGQTHNTPRAELVVDFARDDTIEQVSTEPAAQITVRNFAPGVSGLRVNVGRDLSAQFTGPGGYLNMSGLPSGLCEIRAIGKDNEGKFFEWATAGDFLRFPHQTLLVYPDPYGRIRPRLCVDGPYPASEPSH